MFRFSMIIFIQHANNAIDIVELICSTYIVLHFCYSYHKRSGLGLKKLPCNYDRMYDYNFGYSNKHCFCSITLLERLELYKSYYWNTLY